LSIRAFASLTLVAWMASGCASLAPLPPLGPPPPGAWPRKPTVFMRIFGAGRLPQLDAPVTYELCLDDDRRKLLAVRPLDGQPPVDERIDKALHEWQWGVGSSNAAVGGTSCWHERFAPAMDDDGRKLMTATVADPQRNIELLDEHETIRLAPREPEGLVLPAIRLDDRGETRLVVLSPSLKVIDVAEPPTQDRDPVERPEPTMVKWRE
jgi:hypothetical protein